MTERLRIGEYVSLGTRPYFFPLRHVFNEPSWEFIPGAPADLDAALGRGEVDVALASPLTLVSSPRDFLVFPDLGYASRRHIRDILLFSDLLLDDMDEMTVSIQADAAPATVMLPMILARYPQYHNDFLTGWGNAEAFLLAGDAALRERHLGRYAYVYDLGDLWKHYTGHAMIYYLWIVRAESLRKKKSQLVHFHRLLKQSLEIARSNWKKLASLLDGYDWINTPAVTQLWTKVEYQLEPAHFEGLHRFFEDCLEAELIDDLPEIEYFEEEEEEEK